MIKLIALIQEEPVKMKFKNERMRLPYISFPIPEDTSPTITFDAIYYRNPGASIHEPPP